MNYFIICIAAAVGTVAICTDYAVQESTIPDNKEVHNRRNSVNRRHRRSVMDTYRKATTESTMSITNSLPEADTEYGLQDTDSNTHIEPDAVDTEPDAFPRKGTRSNTSFHNPTNETQSLHVTPNPEPLQKHVTETITVTKAEASAEAEADAEAEAEAEADAEADAEAEVEAKADADAEAEATDREVEPEAETGDIAMTATMGSAFGLCIVLIIVGNSIVGATIVKSKELRNNTSNVFLLSLVSARMSVGLFVVPARISGMFSEKFMGNIFCKLCHYAALVSSTASVLSIVSLAVTKYILLVLKPDMQDLSFKDSGKMLGGVWMLSLLYGIRAPITNSLHPRQVGGVLMWACTGSPEYRDLRLVFIIVDFVVMFLLPFVAITYIYRSVINKLASSIKGAATKQEKRQTGLAIRMLVILVILFTICTSAPYIFELCTLFVDDLPAYINIIEAMLYLFSYSNSWMNVIVFYTHRADLRQAFGQITWLPSCYGPIVAPNQTTDGLFTVAKHKLSNKVQRDRQTSSIKTDALRAMEF